MALIHSRVVFNHEEEQICSLQGSEDHLVMCNKPGWGQWGGVRAGDESRSWSIREREGSPWGETNVGNRKTRGNQSGLDACM